MTARVIARHDGQYPPQLKTRLGKSAPSRLSALGNLGLLSMSKTALFCSSRTPGQAILAAHDQAARWRDEGRCVISGFHAPLERDCLNILLRGRQPIVVCLARGLERMRLPADWKKPLDDGRLLMLSGFPESVGRASRDTAAARNRLVAALADEVVFAFVAAGGQLTELSRLVASWGMTQRILTGT